LSLRDEAKTPLREIIRLRRVEIFFITHRQWSNAARVKAKSKPAKIKLTSRQASKKRIRK
jgi:hypothetical protein